MPRQAGDGDAGHGGSWRDDSRVEEGRGGVEAWPKAPFPFPAHQTGRADFPHPAFRQTSRQAHGGDQRRLRLAVELVRLAPDRSRCFAGSSPITSILAHFPSTSEVRGLCSAGVTRPRRSYAPVRLPLEAAIPKTALRLAPHPKRVSPDDPSLSSDAPRPLPRRIEPVHLSMTSQLVRPAPSLRRVGIRIKTFEACSGFTRVTARKIAQLPKATFVTRLRSSQSPGQTARQLPDPSTLVRVESSSTRETRLQGARRGRHTKATAARCGLKCWKSPARQRGTACRI